MDSAKNKASKQTNSKTPDPQINRPTSSKAPGTTEPYLLPISEDQETDIFKTIKNIQFWQDESLTVFLENKYKDDAKRRELETAEQEIFDMESELETLEKLFSEKTRLAEEEREVREKELRKIKAFEEEVRSLEKQNSEEKEKSNLLKKRIQDLEDPGVLAEHIYSSFDKEDGIDITSQIQNNFTMQIQSIHNMHAYLMYQNAFINYQMQMNQGKDNNNTPNNNSGSSNMDNKEGFSEDRENKYSNSNGMNHMNQMSQNMGKPGNSSMNNYMGNMNNSINPIGMNMNPMNMMNPMAQMSMMNPMMGNIPINSANTNVNPMNNFYSNSPSHFSNTK